MRRGPALAWRSSPRHIISMLMIVIGLACVPESGNAETVTTGTPFRLPSSSLQLIVGVAANWDTNTVVLQRFVRASSKKPWKATGKAFPGKLGKNGLAWGLGLHPDDAQPAGTPSKREGDLRSPVGVFGLGQVFGFAPDVPRRETTPYVQVTDADLLVEDPNSPMYNSYVRLDHPATSDWEKSQTMERVDPAHELKVFVKHNVDPAPVPGKGSAILLHIWRREGAANTAGCTAMERDQMFATVKWLDMSKNPLFVLLPADLYRGVAEGWGLPKMPKLASPSPTAVSTVPVTTGPATTLAKVKPPRSGVTTIPGTTAATLPGTVPTTRSADGVEVVGEPVTAAPEPPSTRRRVTTTQAKGSRN